MITLTPSAADELRRMLLKKESPTIGLRLAVERGGCAGLQYAMKISEPETGDEVMVHPNGARLYVAHDSIDFLRGSEIDYSDTLSDAGFKISNPNATRSCGCGTSFEPAKTPNVELPQGQPCDS